LAHEASSKSAQIQHGSVLVEVESQPGQVSGATSALTAAGAIIRATYRDWIDAFVPATALLSLDNVTAIKWVDIPAAPQPQATNEALGLINATAWQTSGVTGTGVKVAIVDSGFSGYTSLLGTALPATVDTTCSAANPDQGGPHGAAVAEIIHAVAPGAQLYFAYITTSVELGNAVNCLIGKNVTVANMSLG
jgi:hypothetical protein